MNETPEQSETPLKPHELASRIFCDYRSEDKSVWQPAYDEVVKIIKENVKLSQKLNEAKEQLDAIGIHTCGLQCQRPMCVLRRDRDAWRACAERLAEYGQLIDRPENEAKAPEWKGWLNAIAEFNKLKEGK